MYVLEYWCSQDTLKNSDRAIINPFSQRFDGDRNWSPSSLVNTLFTVRLLIFRNNLCNMLQQEWMSIRGSENWIKAFRFSSYDTKIPLQVQVLVTVYLGELNTFRRR